MDAAVDTTAYLLVLGAVLGIFAILGFRQGWLRELVFFGGLGLGYLLLTQTGTATFRALSNQVIMTVKIIGRSRGDFAEAAKAATELAGQEWVNDTNQALVLTMALAFVLLITYMLGTRFKKKHGVLGGLVGAVNGYLILNLLQSYLSPYLPQWIPLTISPQEGTAAPDGALLRPAIELSEGDFKVVITLFLALILLMTAVSIRPKKKKDDG
jgi:hypothetical protein